MADIKGTAAAETLAGGSSDDTIQGFAGADTLKGGGGADTLIGGADKDVLYGDAGNDVFLYSVASDIVAGEKLFGGADTDTLRLYAPQYSSPVDISGLILNSVEHLELGTRTTAIISPAQLAAFSTIQGEVQLSIGGTVTFSGAMESGNLNLANAATVFDASSCTSDLRVFAGAALSADDTITTGAGNDELSGLDGNDILHGGAGYDLLGGGYGIDQLYGDAGDDSLLISGEVGANGEIYDGGDGYDTLSCSGSGYKDLSEQTLRSIEKIYNLGYGDAVTLKIAQFDMTKELWGSFAVSDGGALKLSGKTLEQFTLTLSDAGNAVDGSFLKDTFYVTGGAGADKIRGGSGTNGLEGEGGNDKLYGNIGNDYLSGGEGRDALMGMGGNDIFNIAGANDVVMGEIIDGGEGNDRIQINTDQAVDLSGAKLSGIEQISTIYNTHVKLTLAQLALFADLPEMHYVLANAGTIVSKATIANTATFELSDLGNTLDLRFAKAGVVYTRGGAGADKLYNNGSGTVADMGGGNDVAFGMAGEDELHGGSGNDRLDGGADNDHLYGDDGADTIIGGSGEDRVDGGAGNDNLKGGDGNDHLIGGAGADTINGGNGADLILGSEGRDLMTGGAGADTFTFWPGDTGATRSGADRITDFRYDQGDRIDLTIATDADLTQPDEQVFTLISGAFTRPGQLHIVVSAGNTYIEGNVDFDLAADIVIRLDGTPVIGAADLIL